MTDPAPTTTVRPLKLTANDTDMVYRPVPRGFAVCAMCDEMVALAYSKARRGQRIPVYVHGPQRQRCPGSGEPGRPWLEATGLPGWEDMSDLDRGCALAFLWKVSWERSYAYARDNYAARYQDHSVLCALDRDAACRHARSVAGSWDDACRQLGDDEVIRLYELAVR